MRVRLPVEFTIHHVSSLKQELLQALRSGEPIELDGTEVQDVDVAGIQLLCALHRDASRRGLTMTVHRSDGTAAMFDQVCDVSGFRRKTGCLAGCPWAEKNHG